MGKSYLLLEGVLLIQQLLQRQQLLICPNYNFRSVKVVAVMRTRMKMKMGRMVMMMDPGGSAELSSSLSVIWIVIAVACGVAVVVIAVVAWCCHTISKRRERALVFPDPSPAIDTQVTEV